MSAIEATPELDDLELLDDDTRHARCCVCTGTYDDLIGVPFVALCGRRAINIRRWGDPSSFPPDACEDCVAQWQLGCPTHGGLT